MGMRIGKVTQVFQNTGRIKVLYEDEGNTSLQLPMLTMNQEYSMPSVGEMVITMHMENGSSKGFVIGTYYGGGMQPKANTGYRKDFGGNAYVICRNGAYRLLAGSVNLLGSGAALNLKGKASLVGSEVTIGSKSEDEDAEPDVYLKITSDEAELKTKTLIIDADNMTLKCSYGEETFENIMRRIERIEDQLGLPHTI